MNAVSIFAAHLYSFLGGYCCWQGGSLALNLVAAGVIKVFWNNAKGRLL